MRGIGTLVAALVLATGGCASLQRLSDQGGISCAEYLSVETGMTAAEVNEIFDGMPSSERASGGRVVIREWQSGGAFAQAGGDLPDYVSISFYEGRVEAKSQVGVC